MYEDAGNIASIPLNGLIHRGTEAQHFIIPNGILPLPAGIAGVSLHDVNHTVFHLFHDAYMVCTSVLAVFIIPIKEDNVSRLRFIISSLPLTITLEPAYTVHTAGEFWNQTAVDIPALVGTPGHKAGAPLYSAVKAVPTPVGFSAFVTNLSQGHLHNGLISACGKGPSIGIIAQHMIDILRIPVATPPQPFRLSSLQAFRQGTNTHINGIFRDTVLCGILANQRGIGFYLGADRSVGIAAALPVNLAVCLIVLLP